jgi:hypothetical protein
MHNSTFQKLHLPVQAHVERQTVAPNYPKVAFEGTSTYDATFQGAQAESDERQPQHTVANVAHALPDAPFDSCTEYKDVR